MIEDKQSINNVNYAPVYLIWLTMKHLQTDVVSMGSLGTGTSMGHCQGQQKGGSGGTLYPGPEEFRFPH